MRIFDLFKTRQKARYNVLKLFQVVDAEESRQFQSLEVMLNVVEWVKEHTGDIPCDFDINYGHKSWKTLEGFVKSVRENYSEELVYTHILYNEEDLPANRNLAGLLFTNSMLNYEEQPSLSGIELNVVLRQEKFSQADLISLTNRLRGLCTPNYGYIINLSEEYDPMTEGKVKSGFLSYSVESKPENRVFWFHLPAVKEGYIKGVYPVNIINASHLKEPVIKALLDESVGKIYELQNGLYAWELNEIELIKVKNILVKTPCLISGQGDSQNFLMTPEAEVFYKQMRLTHMPLKFEVAN